MNLDFMNCIDIMKIRPGSCGHGFHVSIRRAMTHRLLTRSLLTACLSTVNGKVYFVSKNFHNVLHWDVAAPAHPGEEVLCSVQYHR